MTRPTFAIAAAIVFALLCSIDTLHAQRRRRTFEAMRSAAILWSVDAGAVDTSLARTTEAFLRMHYGYAILSDDSLLPAMAFYDVGGSQDAAEATAGALRTAFGLDALVLVRERSSDTARYWAVTLLSEAAPRRRFARATIDDAATLDAMLGSILLDVDDDGEDWILGRDRKEYVADSTRRVRRNPPWLGLLVGAVSTPFEVSTDDIFRFDARLEYELISGVRAIGGVGVIPTDGDVNFTFTGALGIPVQIGDFELVPKGGFYAVPDFGVFGTTGLALHAATTTATVFLADVDMLFYNGTISTSYAFGVRVPL